MVDLHEALYTTRAMRRVRPEPVPDDVVARIIDAAVRAHSGGNQQRWRFPTVTDPSTKATLQQWYRDGLTTLNATEYAAVMEQIATSDPDCPTGRWDLAARSPAHEVVFSERWGRPVTWTVPEPLGSPP